MDMAIKGNNKMKKLTTKQIANVINKQGLEDSVKHYLDHKEIKDSTLSRLWLTAQEALKDIEIKLNIELGKNWRE